jgi:hypothetical protein
VSPNKLAHDDVQDKKTVALDHMDVQDNVEATVGRHRASPDEPVAELGVQSAMTGTPNGITSSPPTLPQDVLMDMDHPSSASVEDTGEKSDSDAETIVLPGKEEHSPSRARKSIKHEDESEDEEMTDAPDVQDLTELDEDAALRADKTASESTIATSLGKRKRTKNGIGRDDTAHLGNSSGLSSVPTSPVATTRSSLSKPAASDSDVSKSPSPLPRSTIRDKAKSVDRVLSRRKQYALGSGDEDEAERESQRFHRQRSSGTDHKSNRDGRSLSKLNADNGSRKRTRSISPHSRGHRRSISTQLPSKSSHGLSHKKKRVPAPLQSTEYHSDDSSASGHSHPRSSRLRNLAAPTTGDSAISPAKMPPHKKHVNSSGQTLLAIACSRGKLDVVKQRYEERPEDVNLADNALNTPLHIASLEGFVDIVQFLIDTGSCELDAVNDLKDTPLHDAVDNKNVEVVKLLLDAGANPSLANTEGNEPLDKISVYGDGDGDGDDEDEDDEDSKEDREKASEMRAAIMAAKQKFTSNARRGSEDHRMHENGESCLSHPKESPRQTPPAHEPQTSAGRMGGTARRMKTRDSHLWMTASPATLQKAASEGDAGAISQILNVNPNLNDAKALFNAARGGHDAVINLLFALGKFNADPDPLDGVPLEQSTPILAAIGKDNHLEVIKLFLAHPDFDPTRRIKGETYYEIAKRRGGPKWQEEEALLKEAFDTYQKSHKSSLSKSRSPGLRRDARDSERESKKSARTDDYQGPRSHKRNTSSPKTKESDSSKNQQRSNSSLTQSKDGHSLGKRGPGRPRKEENSSTVLSDRETSPLGPPKQKSQSKKVESDTPLSENDPTVKPRRKLMSRGERELEKQRRASIASNASSVSVKEKRERGSSDTKPDKLDGKSSPSIPRISKGSTSGLSDRELTSDKTSSEKDRARSLKRDDSKDRLTAIRSESPVKRPRKSETPPRSNMQEVTAAYGSGGSPQKRRKVDSESVAGPKSECTPSSSPEHRTTSAKGVLSRENTSSGRTNTESKAKSSRSSQKPSENSEGKDSIAIEKSSSSRQAKSASTSSSVSDPPPRKPKHSGDRSHKETSDAQSSQVKLEEEEVQRQAQVRREKKEAEASRQKELEEEKERERIENARQARLAREQAAREEEEKRQREDTERKLRQQKEDAEAHDRAMEEQRKLYLEQERLKKEEADRRRAAAQEQQRIERARLEKERREERLAKLPLLLKWFDQVNNPQTPEVANLFKRIAGYRYDTIKPEATGQAIGREQWMLNIHVAILLGEKDLQLSRCESIGALCDKY